MTTYTAVATGGWRVPATWDVGSGYPDGLDDDFVITGYSVTIGAGDDDIAGHGDVGSGGVLTVGTGSSLELGNSTTPALDVLSGGELRSYGQIKGQESGNRSRVHMREGSIFTNYAGHALRRIQWVSGIADDISDIYGDTIEADQVTCHPYASSGGTITFDESCAVGSINAESGTVIFDAGITVKFAANANLTSLSNGIVQVNGTVSSPVIFECYTPGSTWRMVVAGHASNVLDWLEVSDLAGAELWDAGGTYGFGFSKQPQEVDPLQNPPILDIDDPLGRDYSRVHAKGGSAGIVEITGNYRYSDDDHKRVDAMMKARSLVGFVNSKMQVPSAYIILNDYKFREGHLTTPYTITLQEAR